MSGLNYNEYAKDILYHEITPHKGVHKIQDGELIKDERDYLWEKDAKKIYGECAKAFLKINC